MGWIGKIVGEGSFDILDQFGLWFFMEEGNDVVIDVGILGEVNVLSGGGREGVMYGKGDLEVVLKEVIGAA